MNGEQNGEQNPPPYNAFGALRPPRKAASSINCRDFNTDKDDFELWIRKFEKAVKLATDTRDGDPQLQYLYKEWLPLKLDDDATAHLDTLDINRLEWNVLKDQLAELLIDPQEELLWRTGESTITWDGKEPIRSLASRIKRKVDKYYKRYPAEVREMECYNRFRGAFQRPIVRFIDMNCPKGSQTLENAKDVVMRHQLCNASKGKSGDVDPDKSVEFAGAQMNPDRATSLETSMASMATHMEDLALSVRSTNDSVKSLADSHRNLEQRICALEESQRRDSSYQPNRRQGGNSYGNSGSGGYQQQSGYSPGRNNNYGGSQQQNGFSSGGNNYGGSQQQRGPSPGRNNNYGGSQQQQRGSSPGRNNFNGQRGGQSNGQSGGQRPSRGNLRGNGNRGNNGYGSGAQNSGHNSGSRPNPGQGNRPNDAYRAIETEDEGSCDEADYDDEQNDQDSYGAAYEGNGASQSGRANQGGN